MKKAIFIPLFVCLINSGLFGQKAPIKFGEISLEDLQMVRYPADTSASAAILCDYGFFNSKTFQFIRIRRIKILKEDGYNWANSEYPCTSDTQITGITANLVDGKIIKEKLKNESIYADKITGQYYVKRIAMPNVKVGSVIDLKFTFIGYMPVWKFQDLIPVQYSELIMEDAVQFGFRYNFFGYEPLFLATPNRWIAKNMPSFKEEPFMSSKENYLTKLEFDISNVGIRLISLTWESISEILKNDQNFGFPISRPAYLNDLTKKIKATNGTREKILKMAYDSIKANVKWNEKESVSTSALALNFPYKMKIGNSADINLILLQLLRKLDFDAVPVVLSTRQNGFLSSFSPSIQKLNYVIVLVRIGDNSILLDACDPMLPYTLIPFRCLNGPGRTVDQVKSDEVVISTSGKDADFTTYRLKVNENQSLEGSLISKRIDYSAYDFRNKYHKFNSIDEYLEDFKKDKTGLQITDFKFNNVDSIYLPVREDYNIVITNQSNLASDELYIYPMFYHQIKENPFKTDARQYPVDFGYNIEKVITTILEIPADYTVTELPASISIKLPDNAASLTYAVAQSENTISVRSVFSINKKVFLPGEEYKNLREFYNKVMKKQSEPIVLKKK